MKRPFLTWLPNPVNPWRKSKNYWNTSAKIIDENAFSEYLTNNKIIFFGDGAEKCKTILSKHSNAIFSKEGLPSARYINQIAFEKFKKQEFEDVAYFEPYYLKDFIATTPKKLL